jgi:hypothetical protein
VTLPDSMTTSLVGLNTLVCISTSTYHHSLMSALVLKPPDLVPTRNQRSATVGRRALVPSRTQSASGSGSEGVEESEGSITGMIFDFYYYTFKTRVPAEVIELLILVHVPVPRYPISLQPYGRGDEGNSGVIQVAEVVNTYPSEYLLTATRPIFLVYSTVWPADVPEPFI